MSHPRAFKSKNNPLRPYWGRIFELVESEDDDSFAQAIELSESLLAGYSPKDTVAFISDALGFDPVYMKIPSGSFMFQSTHPVEVPEFLLGQTEVTNSQWGAIMPSWGNGSFESNDLPVANVSWNDTQRFIGRLNRILHIAGCEADLPHEVEWEYAAKAGQDFEYSGSDDPDEVAWYDENSGGKAHPVAQKKPNAWGLYDMSGNVWEWCKNQYYSSIDQSVADFNNMKAKINPRAVLRRMRRRRKP
jgi:formylglycine-generating enzyme required for sulfatase activity